VLSCPPAFAGVNNRALRYAQIGPFSASTDIITEPGSRSKRVERGQSPVRLGLWSDDSKKILIQIKTRESALTYTYRISQHAIRLRAVISI
jgi:hypothetical protein